ncbi:MAG: MerR family transcriptional regulator [Thermodesulfobacteriota bacterium]
MSTEDLKTGKDIPDKRYFRIGEVSALTGLESYVLRFWETEFKGISPKRTESGQRLYRRSDVELIHKIKHLLHEKKFTIQGAKQYLNASPKKDRNSVLTIDEIRSELLVIREILSLDAG